VKGAARPNLPPYGGAYSAGEDFTKKRTEAMTKFKSFKENFENREKKIRADLEKARKIWKKVGERFNPFDSLRSLRVDTERSRSIKWWRSLP